MANPGEPLRKLLNNIADEHNYKNPEIIINNISSGGANYSSKLYTATIKEKNKEDLNLFGKVAAVGGQLRNKADADVYDTEKFAYTKLMKIYAALEEKHGVPEEHRLPVVKFYGFDDSAQNQETMVLENLLVQGYEPFDRFKSYDWEYASAAVTECAKFHALSFAFQKDDPEEFQKTLGRPKPNWVDMGIEALLKKATSVALKVVRPEHKRSLEKFMSRDIQELFLDFYNPIRATVIIHGDYRGSNLMHRVRKDGKVDIKILDLQTLQAGSPITDLIYFIFMGSDEQFRARYFDQLVEHYYSQLSAAMRRLHLNPHELFPKKDFDEEFKLKLQYGLTFSVFGLPIVTVTAEDAPKVDESLSFDDLGIEKTNDLYNVRINGVVDDFVRWGILK
uniref:CHK kinase-like domain-containing protein n=1 Tax=Heliothis virescens TaxID=7102 RepID=A0A2A4JJH8_HELVI